MKIVTLETCKCDKKITYECTDNNLKKDIKEKMNQIKKNQDQKIKEKLLKDLQYLLDLCNCISSDEIENEYDYKIINIENIK